MVKTSQKNAPKAEASGSATKETSKTEINAKEAAEELVEDFTEEIATAEETATAKENMGIAKEAAAKEKPKKKPKGDDKQEQIDALKETIEGMKGEPETKPTVQMFNPKTGQPIQPEYREDELSEHTPHDRIFNKVTNYNRGTKTSAIGIREKVDYFHFYQKNKQYTFWRGIPLTKTQVKELPKKYIKYICSPAPKKS